MIANETPLTGPPPAEVPLEDAPLIRVIAQVRFPLVASVDHQNFMAPFQEAIRSDYPILRPEQSRSVALGPQGVMDARSGNVWRFLSAKDGWRISLAPDFLALETTQYTSRNDFLKRLEQALVALRDKIDPQVIDRLGVRYIDRIVGDNLQELPSLVRPEIAGVMASSIASQTLHAISENMFALPDESGQLLARWGHVPAEGTVDPAAVDPIAQESWLLDIDAFKKETQTLDVDIVLSQARAFAERIYSFFRWVVTDEFLKQYGDKP